MKRVKRSIGLLTVLASWFLARPVLSCQVIGGPEAPASLVGHADVIAWVRAEGCSGKAEGPGTTGVATECQVRFRVLEVIKGKEPSATLGAKGYLTDDDDPNDVPVPYHFVRPRGRSGNCFAYQYKEGAEYLLMLRWQEGRLTPYWAALAATNEQVRGHDDPWLRWVRTAVRVPVAP